MKYRDLKTSQVTGIIFGLIVAVMLTGFRIPPAFAFAVGIIFGIVVFVVLNDNKTGQ
jgi:zinc transporter ZupT